MERSMSVHLDSRDHARLDPVRQGPSFWLILLAGFQHLIPFNFQPHEPLLSWPGPFS
jgi:hypothetical protein